MREGGSSPLCCAYLSPFLWLKISPIQGFQRKRGVGGREEGKEEEDRRDKVRMEGNICSLASL